MTTTKVIPLHVVHGDSLDDVEARHEHLQSAGYLLLMQISEPRLSEVVAKYRAKGYDVEVLPLLDEGDLANATTTSGNSCGPGSCSSGGGCSSGGCGSGAPNGGSLPRRSVARQAVAGVGTVYIRMPSFAAIQT
jgi:hypothetical protein